jgi:glycosyltransferase involved in cell wall biosynthesis
MSKPPLVSILINNFNYARFLPFAIDAALSQTYDRVEVIVVDDGSKDESKQVIERYGDRIRAIFKPNGGQASAFNAGFAASQGDIICFLDADDYCTHNKVSLVVEQFQQYPEAGWLFHALQKVDATGLPIAGASPGWMESLTDFRRLILQGQPIRTTIPATSGLCFQRSLLTQTLPMPEQLRLSADNFLRLSAMLFAPGLLLSEKLAFHRMHGSNHYEAGKNQSFLHAETNIQTSYYLRKRFSQMGAFTEQLFAHSLGQMVGRREFAKATQIAEFSSYLKEFFSYQAWIRNSPRILVNIAKSALAH